MLQVASGNEIRSSGWTAAVHNARLLGPVQVFSRDYGLGGVVDGEV